jgi:hypothetical protein
MTERKKDLPAVCIMPVNTTLSAIWHSAGRSNLLAEVKDVGVPSDFVLGMTLAIHKLLFLLSVFRLTLVSAGGWTSVSLNILSVLELQNRILSD